MATGCALAISILVDLLEAGGQPFPILFDKNGCNQDGRQWPPVASFGSVQSLIGQKINLQATAEACLLPAFPGISDSPIPNVLISECPLPAVLSAIVPNNMTVTFETNDNANVVNLVKERGIFVLDETKASNNIFTIPSTTSTEYRWGSITNNGGTCVNSFALQMDSQTNSGTLRASNFSCGAPFWPSLTASGVNLYNNVVNQSITDPTRIDADRLHWESCSNKYSTRDNPAPPDRKGVCTWSDNTDDSPQVNYASACMNWVQANAHGVERPFDGLDTASGNIMYNRCECLTNFPAAINVINDSCANDAICDGAPDAAWVCDWDTDYCTCHQGASLGASLKYVTVNQTIPWAQQQAEFCTGTTLSIGNIVIDRYTNGSLACDPLVEQICQNTAEISNNPSYQTLCACILEQKRLNAQFAGLDLPIQCFSDVCNESNPAVYKTSQQAQGCSARLCIQIVNINGSAIASEGYQTLLCDGQVYNVAPVNPSVSGVPNVTPGLGDGGIHLGIVFYIALGLLVMMFVLLIAWGIRKFVMQKRAHATNRKLITQALESAVGTA